MKRSSSICLFLLAMLVSAGSAPAAEEAPFPPGGFRLPTSNGYSLHALSFDGDPHGKPDELILFVGRKGGGATYFVLHHVTITETTIAADLGRLGSIDLHFVPSGETKKEHPRCQPKQSVEFDSGFYEGRVDFEGEEGFTAAHATRAAGELQLGLNLFCPGGPKVDGIGGNAPGAQLHGYRRWPGGKVELQASTNSPTRPVHFKASIEERGGDLLVIREVAVTGAPSAFRFDVPAQTARLAPPAPFRGVGHFKRREEALGRLRGGLTVDFPGNSHVSLAGIQGGMVRYVANPGQVFRPLSRLSLERMLDE